MIKNWLSDGRWALPGGGIAKNETISQALVREVKEEIGLDIGDIKKQLLTSGEWQTYNFGFKYLIYASEIKLLPKYINKLEITEWSWCKQNALDETKVSQEVLAALRKLVTRVV